MRSAEEASEELEALPRGRHNLAPETVSGVQRRRILEAMVSAAAERGYAETRIVDVISAAGVSRKTFYEQFADREECFLAAYDEVVARMLEATEAGFEADPGAPWADRIRAGMAALLELLAAEPGSARFAIIEALAAGPKALTRRDAAIRRFTHLIDAGRAESSNDLPGITAVAISGGINELLYSEILHGATASLPARLPDIMFWITQPYLGAERAAAERERARKAAGAPSSS